MKFIELIKNKNESRKIAVFTGIIGTYSNTLISIVNGIVLVPIYLRFFGKDIYGAWLATAGMISMLALLEGGINQVITQRLAKSYSRGNSNSFKMIFSSGLIINVFISLFIIIIGFFFSKIFTFFIELSKPNIKIISNAIIIASIGTAFSLFQSVAFSPFYAWQRVYVVTIVALISSILSILVNIICLFNNMGVISISMSILTNGILGVSLSVILANKHMKSRHGRNWLNIKYKHILLILKKSIPLYLNKIVTTVANNIEPILIASLINPATVVIYNVTYKLMTLASSIINPIAGSIMGSTSHLIGNSNKTRQREVISSLVFIQTVITTIVLVVLGTINKDFVEIWVGKDYYGGNLLSSLLILQILVQTRFNLFSSIIQSTGDFKTTAFSEIVVYSLKITFVLIILKLSTITFLPLASILSLSFFSIFFYPKKIECFLQINDKYLQSNGIYLILHSFVLYFMYLALLSSSIGWISLIIKASAIFIITAVIFLLLSRRLRDQLSILTIKKQVVSNPKQQTNGKSNYCNTNV